ncbi:hypothetical protein [Saccharopolyspora sp. 5N708]|uniref:hypothetical protein n=1 Tax=Saccharopolyspora sp. 5N708 TaxID=3457424 RepID=UPI003FD23F25
MRILRIAAGVEAASLAALLINLCTAHLRVITTLGGPLHGMAYLVVIAITFATTRSPAARWCAVIPGVGGLLAVRKIPISPRKTRGPIRTNRL